MDPVTIGIVAAVVAAVFSGTGPILPRLWRGLKKLYGRACQSAGYLRTLDRQRLNNDIQTMMLQNAPLRSQAQRYYLEGGITRAAARGSGGGQERAFIEFSDFSDFSD